MDLQVPPALKENEWFNFQTQREKDIILCLLSDAADKSLTTLDTSQQIMRVAKGYHSILPTLSLIHI